MSDKFNIGQFVGRCYESACSFASKVGETSKKIGVSTAEATKKGYELTIYTVERAGTGFKKATTEASEVLKKTSSKIANFVNQVGEELTNNVDNLIYAGCVGATAFFSPHLLVSGAISSLVVRLEVTRRLRQVAYEYMRDTRNPYLEKNGKEEFVSKKEQIVSTFDVVLATVGFIDVLVKGAFFITRNPFSNPMILNFITNAPALAGIAAGNSLAKAILNKMNPEGIKTKQNEMVEEA